MRALLLTAVAVLIAGFVGYRSGVRSVVVTSTESVVFDTVYFEKPTPVRVLPPTFATVRISRLVFAPADTVALVATTQGDSVELKVEIAHTEYGDSTYRAQVSGPRVGEFGPELDWIHIINRTTERAVNITSPARRSRFAVTLGAGVAYTPKGVQPYIGLGAGVILWQK